MSGHPDPCGHLLAARAPALRRRHAGRGAGRHYLSSCALLYAATCDESVCRKAGALVAGLTRCQRGDGYLGLHADTQVPKAVAAARTYEIDGDARQRRTAMARNVPPALPPLRVDIAGFGVRAMQLPIAALDPPSAAATVPPSADIARQLIVRASSGQRGTAMD